jgi:hypothetical protein
VFTLELFPGGDNPEVTEEIGSYLGSNGTTPTGGRGFGALPPSLVYGLVDRSGGIDGATSSFGRFSGIRRNTAGYLSGFVFSSGSVLRHV